MTTINELANYVCICTIIIVVTIGAIGLVLNSRISSIEKKIKKRCLN